jgi:hypothetical protein
MTRATRAKRNTRSSAASCPRRPRPRRAVPDISIQVPPRKWRVHSASTEVGSPEAQAAKGIRTADAAITPPVMAAFIT